MDANVGREHPRRRRRPSLRRPRNAWDGATGHLLQSNLRATRRGGCGGLEHSRRSQWTADSHACKRDNPSALALGAATMRRATTYQSGRIRRALLFGALIVVAAACGNSVTDNDSTSPPPPATLDDQLRAQFNPWGVVPIGAVNAPSTALVDLGRSLFFDKV